ncbi:HalOD1 output domain-containing protein [Natrinema sp. 1APR25-10V2]|uniref:HalOD1 output domain-containing protein n=1 Tax=Natrinema sp. 1APR25-10V2 TaxID=2951081 RepID=UPI002876EE09|nr:HalOD1 output domain-containing protein [Natrinema sp. 1APR25-10V2]MDS0476896.1 hypothetical protein [Natrinema sp. 1APR25-10V2]
MTDRSNPSSEEDTPSRIEWTFDDDRPPSIAIIQAIAVIEDMDPMDLPDEAGITLYDHIDPDALDRLATGTTNMAAVTISLEQPDHQYAVQIRDTGQLVVQKAG